MKILAVGNQKGGVSKTTTALNLAYCMANTFDQKVLLVDMDSQASASLALGLDVYNEDMHTIDELFDTHLDRNIDNFNWKQIQQCIYTPTYEDREKDPADKMRWRTVKRPFGMDIIPSSLQLSVIELRMGLVGGKLFHGIIYSNYLKNLLATVEENADYDLVIIDTPPSLGALSLNSLSAAEDGIIIVSSADPMALRGVNTFIETVETVQSLNPAHRGILGIVLALFSERRVVDRTIEDWVKDFLPIPTFDTKIPDSAAEVKRANSSLLLYTMISKKGKAKFDALAYEILYALEHPTELIGSAKHIEEENNG